LISNDEFDKLILDWALSDIKESIYTILKLPEVKGETISATIKKSFFSLIKNKDFRQKLAKLQDNQKDKLYRIQKGETPEVFVDDPLNTILQRREQKVEEEKQNAEKIKQENPKKGGFGFLGSQDSQAKLIEEIMNKNQRKNESQEGVGQDANQKKLILN